MGQSDGTHGRAFATSAGHPSVSVVHRILPWPRLWFHRCDALWTREPCCAENDVQHLALDFAASLLFFSDVAGGRDNTTKIVPFPTMRRV